MFKIPTETQRVWNHYGTKPFTDADLARIEGYVGLSVPEAYKEFAKAYGQVSFTTTDTPCAFGYRYERDGAEVRRMGAISHFIGADRVLDYYQNLAEPYEGDDTVPKFPKIFLPIGLDFDQNTILIELGGPKERIWYWEFQDEAWGEGDNTQLGLIADDLYIFVNTLEMFSAWRRRRNC